MLSRVFTTREQVLMIACAAAVCVGGITYNLANRPKDPAVVAIPEVKVPVPQKVEALAPAPGSGATVPTATVSPVSPLPPVHPPSDSLPTRRISVSVTGAVAEPGVYDFDEHDRVQNALAAAGGASASADLSDINKAAELIDGSALVVPLAGKAGIEDGKRLVVRNGESAAALNPPQYTISGWRQAAQPQPAPAVSADRLATTPTASAGSGVLDINSATAEELETLPGIGPKLAGAIIEYRGQHAFQSVDDLNDVPGIGEKRLAELRPHVRVGP